MSHKQINHSPDLKRLQDEGYEIEVRGAFVLIGHVPYVNAGRQIKFGTLISTLNLAGSRTAPPESHVISFVGEYPCNWDATPIQAIRHTSNTQVLDQNLGIVVNHNFSNKPPNGPPNGYHNYYDKFTSYIGVISSQAEAIDPSVTAKTFKVIQSMEAESVFHYLDTNSSRAEINLISSKLENYKIAIVGLGGTGSYVLDFVAKTSVTAIHLFDGDVFLQHNAFRSPGAASLQQLDAHAKKVEYLAAIYSNMRKNIVPHTYHLGAENADELLGFNFVFICSDDGETKKPIIGRLVAAGIPFCDVGMGLEVVDNALTGVVRTTTGTPAKHDHIGAKVSFSTKAENLYSQNIQIGELNALNAALAVIKWKKLAGFYHDIEKEHDSGYVITTNKIINDDSISQIR